MPAEIKKLFYLLDERSKKLLPLFMLATVIISFVEIIGIGLIYPFLRILIDPESIGNSWYLSKLFYLVTGQTECIAECTEYGPTINQFLIKLGIAIVAKIPIIATTIINSIRVKPFCFFFHKPII